jgi:hypothetical protein
VGIKFVMDEVLSGFDPAGSPSSGFEIQELVAQV